MKFKDYIIEKQIQMDWDMTRNMEDFNMDFYNDEVRDEMLELEIVNPDGEIEGSF